MAEEPHRRGYEVSNSACNTARRDCPCYSISTIAGTPVQFPALFCKVRADLRQLASQQHQIFSRLYKLMGGGNHIRLVNVFIVASYTGLSWQRRAFILVSGSLQSVDSVP